ncbi:MAG TPA: hypothetical protein VFV02_10045 [Acidimicrobiales bacterium]|nr:hypothetical protein [Acidimicrobiales bacterium]
MSTKAYRLGATLALTTALMAGPALPAHADPAPSCVTVSSSQVKPGYTRFTITNTCRDGQWVKVIVSFNPDIGCTYYAPGQARSYVYSWPSNVDRLESC